MEDLRLRRAEFDFAVYRRGYWYLLRGLFARGDRSDLLAHALISTCARELDAGELRAYLALSDESDR